LPTNYHPAIASVLQEHYSLFNANFAVTDHVIGTGDALPIKVPPRPIPFHFAECVHKQFKDTVSEGIIRPSNSPWCVSQANGEIHICDDFTQLNKVSKKDTYPAPRTEGPQQKFTNKQVFSKIDLKSTYWQFPMNETSIEKTAGPGYGLLEFTAMQYGLTGATQTCQ